jgi:hypothetical protein
LGGGLFVKVLPGTLVFLDLLRNNSSLAFLLASASALIDSGRASESSVICDSCAACFARLISSASAVSLAAISGFLTWFLTDVADLLSERADGSTPILNKSFSSNLKN